MSVLATFSSIYLSVPRTINMYQDKSHRELISYNGFKRKKIEGNGANWRTWPSIERDARSLWYALPARMKGQQKKWDWPLQTREWSPRWSSEWSKSSDFTSGAYPHHNLLGTATLAHSCSATKIQPSGDHSFRNINHFKHRRFYGGVSGCRAPPSKN